MHYQLVYRGPEAVGSGEKEKVPERSFAEEHPAIMVAKDSIP